MVGATKTRNNNYFRFALYFAGARRLPATARAAKKKPAAAAFVRSVPYLWGGTGAGWLPDRGVSSVGSERHPDTVEVVGSSPIRLTKTLIAMRIEGFLLYSPRFCPRWA